MSVDLVAVGSSLGGLAALQALLGGLPPDFDVPIVIAQHRGPDTDSRLADLLARRTPLTVREPDDKEPIERGTVYLAPSGYHLLVESEHALALSVDERVSHARPSIDVLFESAAEAMGGRLVAVLLTASSEDGAAGIVAVAERGGVTVVEDPSSALSPVAGLAALARTAVDHVCPLPRIGPLLGDLVAGRTPRREAK